MSNSKKAMKDAMEPFESLFEYSPYAIFIHDFEKIMNVNKAFLELYGYKSKSDIVGKPPTETLISPEDFGIIEEARKTVKKGESFFVPMVQVVKSDGTKFLAESHIATIMLDGKPHLRISSRDITEEKKAERNLRESEKKFRTLFENSLDGIYKSTPAGKFVEVNPAMVEMLGYDSEEELKAIDIKTQLYFEVEDRKIVSVHEEDQYPVRRKDGSRIWVEDQYSLKRKDGSGIWVEDHGHYDYNDQGEIIFHHGILRDVTAKIEKQKELENLVIVTEDQNRRLQNFAHIVSHNIRSHSSNMSSLVHFMETTESEEEKRTLFGMLKTSADKLEETIRNLNEIITINQNLKKAAEMRNLNDEVNNTIKVLSGDIRKSKIMISVEVQPNVTVNVIPAYLDSILLNLISNAIKYQSPNVDSTLVISSKQEKEYTVLSLSDNGLGIDMKKNADKVFGMYETFHRREDSRGFGLYITKNQIEAMDGKIECESKIGVGSTFKVYFLEAD